MSPLELPLSRLVQALQRDEVALEDYFAAALAGVEARDRSVLALLPEEGRKQRLEERARELRSVPAGERPPLYGVLVGVKDIMKVAGLPMQAGSQLPAEAFAGPEAAIVSRLRSLGAVVLGRTVTTEFAYFAPGPTRNPRGLEHTPGGSSSGSAAAVAAGYAPIALGTQTIGSVSRPAAFCGVVGVKPTAGKLPREGVFPFSPTADQIGYFVRSVDDAAFVLKLLLPGSDGAGTLPTPSRDTNSSPGPRFAVPHENYLSCADPAGRRHFDATLTALSKAGAEVVSTFGLEDFDGIRERHRRLISAEFAGVHESLVERYASLYSSQSLALISEGKKVGEREHAEARQSCASLREELDGMLSERGCDAWLSPAAPSVAPHGIERTGDPVMNLPWTHAGVPTLAIPSGSDDRGLPFGLQVAGRFNGDRALVTTGGWLEERLPG